MARRKQIPVRKNFAFLIPALPYIATGATVALKATAVALVGATVSTAAYSVYVVSEEEKKRKDLPRLSEILENNIANIRAGISVPFTMPTSLWNPPTDTAQASLRVAWLYMLAAIKNPQHEEGLLQNAENELEQYRTLEGEGGVGQSFLGNDPELQYAYLDMMDVFNNLRVVGMDKFVTGVTKTQDPDEIDGQILLEEQMKDEASITTALVESAKDLADATGDVVTGGKCGADILTGLLTGQFPKSCKLTKWQWRRLQVTVYGGIGLVAAAYILPPVFRVAAPIVERVLEKED